LPCGYLCGNVLPVTLRAVKRMRWDWLSEPDFDVPIYPWEYEHSDLSLDALTDRKITSSPAALLAYAHYLDSQQREAYRGSVPIEEAAPCVTAATVPCRSPITRNAPPALSAPAIPGATAA